MSKKQGFQQKAQRIADDRLEWWQRQAQRIADDEIERWRNGLDTSESLDRLDTYADCGEPESVWLFSAVRDAIADRLGSYEVGPLAGRSIGLVEQLVSNGFI